MLKSSLGVANRIEAYRPILDLLESVLVTPKELCEHWRYTDTHLCNVRRAGRGLPFVKLETGGIRYRTSEIIAAEISGTSGPLTVERVCLALAACSALSVEERAAAQAHVRAAFKPIVG